MKYATGFPSNMLCSADRAFSGWWTLVMWIATLHCEDMLGTLPTRALYVWLMCCAHFASELWCGGQQVVLPVACYLC
jgi:hypothetical protein